ncbi:acetyl-/propionyl-CoA carboxylase subunit alpha [Sinomonas cellulolyticus]|uniref:biotin carboxylase n=1 Tax=Sinomonas cellulolyticus TaxID=2801916 RepID=A0ABS1JX62_9MICC|nr:MULTISPECIES: biotin carboxylase N-terminal domain-containing protein [Sinomonas]MBL0703920.1 ATP-grasp domain-containing protein [Sinomonas cellulolyticus]GHG57637.1 acetyl-/propionyl-CoA carboxylase subunit alpha [Sinomonas sp. KCTC 49339]
MRKVLIANRGEIAVRVARACDDAGLESVAVYADPDADAPHTAACTEAYALGGTSPAETYLDIAKILDVARRSGADAVHPGYGFLSENAAFAQAVLDAGLTWIGPSPQTIRLLGDKVSAREVAVRAGAPLAPGTDGPVASASEVRAFAEEHGLPVAIKAAHGGGGRGLKVARTLEGIEEAYESAVRESQAAFGRGECFVEKFLDRPRHVEAQVLADTHGNVVVVGTRDCSLQRRYQKLVEEAPAPFLTPEQRARIHSSAKAICREAGYVGAGTVEYLLGVDGTVSFLEVNTRLQVEHPITEETSGVDLVAAQLRIADGGVLPVLEDPEPRGHSIEFRINAEDPGRGFLPSPGTVTRFSTPTGPGIRIDSGVRDGFTVPSQFDSLLAKLVVTGADRQQALRRARRALREFEIEGLPTVLPFDRAVVDSPAFTAEDGGDSFGVYTTWIESEFAGGIAASPAFTAPSGHDGARRTFAIDLDGRRVTLGLPAELLAGLGAAVTGRSAHDGAASSGAAPAAADLTAGMGGTVVKWLVEPGAAVEAGDGVVVLEAMKMETTVQAHRSGTVGEHGAPAGAPVEPGTVLTTISGD